MAQAVEANLILEISFKMNSIQVQFTWAEVSCPWQIQEKTPMDLNCKFILCIQHFSYITFKSCPHLDGKHAVFGKILLGLDFLDRVEGLPTDE